MSVTPTAEAPASSPLSSAVVPWSARPEAAKVPQRWISTVRARAVRLGVPVVLASEVALGRARESAQAVARRVSVSPGSAFGHSRSVAARVYYLPMFIIVTLSVGLLVYEFTLTPIPPGVDPGHWLSASYPYVGLPTAPDPADHLLTYSPLMFPFLGSLVILTQSPTLAATTLAVGLFLMYGLTVMHLARRFLNVGVLQVGLVGMAMFCGTTIQMFFWGAYPNFVGFIAMNEALVFFLLYVRDRQTRDGALFFLAVGLTYLGDSLSFAELGAILASSLFLLLLLGKVPWRFLWDKRNIAGGIALGALVLSITELGRLGGATSPGYISGNPSAYVIDEVGEIFSPLGNYPAFWPSGSSLQLAPLAAVAILLAVPLALLSALILAKLYARSPPSVRLVVATGWLAGVCAVPAVGYLAHVDTDYTRFLYFIPLPFALLILVTAEKLWGGRLVAVPTLTTGSATSPSRGPRDWARGHPSAAAGTVVAIGLALLFITVSIPAFATGESQGTAVAHDPSFLAAMKWLKADPTPGNVLTTSGAARWLEALTNREEFTVGPTWLLFEGYEIYKAQGSLWALYDEYTLSNGNATLAYSGFNTTLFAQAPLYTPYVDGVPFPIFRILPYDLSLNVTESGVAETVPLWGTTAPVLSVSGANGGSATVVYSTTAARVVETATFGAAAGATIQFQVLPSTGVTLHSLTMVLTAPPGSAPGLARDSLVGIRTGASTLTWTTEGALGQNPNREVLTTQIDFSESLTFHSYTNVTGVPSWTGIFPIGSGSEPFTLTLAVSTPGANDQVNTLPPVFSTVAFLHAQEINFIVWPNGAFYETQIGYEEAAFGYRSVYSNPEWVVLERPSGGS